ncbi:MAG TPA: DUF2298 domain-containing protein [Methanospirillum sp.]|nr:DUF2298 domain-containing protein [Methanospirillum sp.]
MITPVEMIPVISWLIIIILLHLSLWPLFQRNLPLIAVPLACSGSILLFTLFSFWAVLLGLDPVFGLLPFPIIFLYSLITGNTSGLHTLSGWIRSISSEWRYYALFGFVFFTMLILRVYSPDISNAEKFMDHGFIASMIRSPQIPPLDPWFAGGTLSVYYYLGHWMLASLGMVSGVPSPVIFTIALPTIAAVAAMNVYGMGHLLLPRLRLLPVAFFFLVNPAFISLAVNGTEWGKLLWDSTRVIDGTINEYPLFSFIFGDVHAHVMGILPQTTLLLLICATITCWRTASPQLRTLLIFFSALALGSLPPTNSWDVLVLAPLVLVTGAALIWGSVREKIEPGMLEISGRISTLIQGIRYVPDTGIIDQFSAIRGGFLWIILVPVIGILCYLPFYFQMQTQGIEGVSIVLTPSSFSSFMMVHGWFLAIIALSLFSVFRKHPWILLGGIPFLIMGNPAAALVTLLLCAVIIRRSGAVDLFAGAGLAILLFCELLYLKDNMGEAYYRMNTIFKFYIGAWLLLSISSSAMAGRLLQTCGDQSPNRIWVIEAATVLLIFALLIGPVIVVASHAGPHTPTLDGLAWLSVWHPEDKPAIAFLRNISGPHILVEAEKGDYEYYSRVSSFTGIPTVIGWPFHEFMWRGDTPPGWYGTRLSDVRSLYEEPARTLSLMKKYQADLLYVGPSERERYQVKLPDSGLKPVWSGEGVIIYGLV